MASRPRFAGLTLHAVRLASGLTLFAYLVTHLANHALGLISLPALEAGRELFLTLWRNPPGTLLLYGALLTHIGCALTGLYRRRRLKQPSWQTTQLIFGLLIPPLLLEHILGTRLAFELLETRDSYTYVLLVYFLFDPWAGLQQASVLLIAWTHACLGLHFWLRLKAGYECLLPYLYASALVFPLLALTGVWVAGRDILHLAADSAWLEQARATIDFADREGLALLSLLQNALLALFFALLGGVLVARVLRRWWQRRLGHIVISYPNGRRVEILQGTTILEASRGAGIPHASVCGGRGRCSTCRVRVERGLARLPPTSEAEARVLVRV
ncbi:MAG: 2Fe-2S iron-sulfur cluster-binding protein, partial [Kiloniellales bacterium]